LDEFEAYAGGFEYQSPQLTLVCNRAGKVLARQTRMDAQYWRRHAREPVRFADSVGTLAERGCAVLMELGPQPILTAAAMRTWPESVPQPQAIASLRRDADAQRCFTEALATAYVTGHRLDFASHRRRPRQSLDLPTYPFQRRAYWFPTTRTQLPSGPAPAAQPAPLQARTGDWLTGVPAEEQLNRITELIRSELGVALRVSAEDIEPDAEFMRLGMDSLIAMELRSRLQAALGTPVPASLFFDHPTVPTLAEGLHELWSDTCSDPDKRPSAIPRADRDGVVACSGAVVVPQPASTIVERL
jgi:acyl transferase domain-containing protein